MRVVKPQIKTAKDILLNNDFLHRIEHSNKYVSEEYQDYGLRLAGKLGDLQHKALYIKLCKEVPRHIIEKAVSFAIDYPNTDNKGRVFMWKLSALAKEKGIKLVGGFRKKEATIKKPHRRLNEQQFELI